MYIYTGEACTAKYFKLQKSPKQGKQRPLPIVFSIKELYKCICLLRVQILLWSHIVHNYNVVVCEWLMDVLTNFLISLTRV